MRQERERERDSRGLVVVVVVVGESRSREAACGGGCGDVRMQRCSSCGTLRPRCGEAPAVRPPTTPTPKTKLSDSIYTLPPHKPNGGK